MVLRLQCSDLELFSREILISRIVLEDKEYILLAREYYGPSF